MDTKKFELEGRRIADQAVDGLVMSPFIKKLLADDISAAIKKAVMDENERCAKVAEDYNDYKESSTTYGMRIAAAIRLSNPEKETR